MKALSVCQLQMYGPQKSLGREILAGKTWQGRMEGKIFGALQILGQRL